MPWTASDAQSHTSLADTPDLQQMWAEVANDRLEQCLATHEGEIDDEQVAQCEGSAIRQANAAVNRAVGGGQGNQTGQYGPQESYRARYGGDTMDLASVARVDLGRAGKVTLAEALTLAREAVTLKATAKGLLRQLTAVLDARDVPASLRKELQDVVDALKRNWSDLSGDAETERGERMPASGAAEADKTVDGVSYPPSAFLVVEDPDMPSTFHLRVQDENGDLDHRLMGAAWAALHGGYRGQQYEGPDKQAAIAKLKRLYSGEDMDVPESESEETMAADTMRAMIRDELIAAGLIEPVAELAEVAIREERGQVVELLDSSGDGNGSGPLRMKVALIEPGLGNAKDSHLYEREMLERDAHLFKGVKMYATDHKRDETNVRTEVSQVLRCPVEFTDTGAPVAEVGVFDPQFAQMVRNREQLGVLDGLHCSIRAKGKVKRNVEFGGQKVNRVEAIIAAESVDWVSQAGAGGRALSLVENSEGTEATMSDKTENEREDPEDAQESESEAEVVEATLTEAGQDEDNGVQEDTVTELSMAETLAILLKADLPDAAKARIAERAPFLDEGALQTAVEAEAAYLQEIAPQRERGPRVTGMGRSRQRTETVEENDGDNTEEAESAILRAYLGR